MNECKVHESFPGDTPKYKRNREISDCILPLVRRGEMWVCFPKSDRTQRRKDTVPKNCLTKGIQSSTFWSFSTKPTSGFSSRRLTVLAWPLGPWRSTGIYNGNFHKLFSHFTNVPYSLSWRSHPNSPSALKAGGHLYEKAHFVPFAALYLETSKISFNIRKSF